MSTDWRAGDRAVFVDDTPNPDRNHRQHLVLGTVPRKGVIYLVEAVVLRYFVKEGWVPRLLIAGESQIWTPSGEDYGFQPRRFRKLIPACDRIANKKEAVCQP